MVILLLTVDALLVVPAFVYKMSLLVVSGRNGLHRTQFRREFCRWKNDVWNTGTCSISNNCSHHVRILDLFVEGGSYRGRMFSGLLCVQSPLLAMGFWYSQSKHKQHESLLTCCKSWVY